MSAGGRKPDEAPEGHKTVSEAAAVLGITPTAVRDLIHGGRLSFMPDETGEPVTTGAGEPRYYIPIHALEEEVRRRRRAATPPDVEKSQREVEAQLAINLAEILGEIEQHSEARRLEVSQLRQEVEQYRKEQEEYQQAMLGLVRGISEHFPRRRRSFWRRLWQRLFER